MKTLLRVIACLMVLGLSPVTSIGAADDVMLPRSALETVRRIAIQHNGRTKPLDSFARETLQLITGSPRVGHHDPVETMLFIMADPEHWQQVPLVSVPFIPLREALGMDRPQATPVGTPSAHPASGGVPGLGRKTTHISYNDLVATRKLMRMLPAIVQKQQREEKLSMLEEETMDAFQRFGALSGLLEQKLNLVPPPRASERVWSPILEPQGYPSGMQKEVTDAWNQLLTAVRAGQSGAINDAAHRLDAALTSLNPSDYPPAWRLQLEVSYNHVWPFRVAQTLYLLAIIGLLLSLSASGSVIWARLGLGACVTAFLVHGAGIAMRVILGGRPPVSNFFETTLWLPFVAVAVALVFERVYRARYLALAASILAAITLVLAEHLPLDSSISPVVAVLHSNLWLTIHVLTIVASYGALALATVLAHVYGVLYLRQRHDASLESLGLFLYRVIQVGVVLLAGGIMLGAVWANASWGRYWGWDPKETWALITLLWFLAVLHGRFAGWITGVGVALSTIGGFFLLLMTYYGVSFYLVGLHSYAGGHAKPIPPLLIGYLMAELAFLATVGLAALNRRRIAS